MPEPRSPARPAVRSGYDRWAEIYDEEANPLIGLEEPVVREALGDVAGLAVLDLGCGTGRHAVWLASAGATVTGHRLLRGHDGEGAAKPGAEKVRFLVHDLHERLPFADGTFDRVVSGLVLEHLPTSTRSSPRRAACCGRAAARSSPACTRPCSCRSVQARFHDPATGEKVEPGSVEHTIGDFVMAAVRAGFALEGIDERAPDADFAARYPRAEKYVGWPMLGSSLPRCAALSARRALARPTAHARAEPVRRARASSRLRTRAAKAGHDRPRLRAGAAVADRPVVDPHDRQHLARDAGDEGLADARQLLAEDGPPLDRHQTLRHLEHQRARHAGEGALLLGAEDAVDDGEEVAGEPLEDRPVVAQDQPLLDPRGEPAVGPWRGGDEPRVLGVRVLAPHVEGHAGDALLVEPRGQRGEGLDRHEEARRGEGEPEARLRVAGRVEGRGEGPARRGRVDRARSPLERRRLLEPAPVLVEAHDPASAVGPEASCRLPRAAPRRTRRGVA